LFPQGCLYLYILIANGINPEHNIFTLIHIMKVFIRVAKPKYKSIFQFFIVLKAIFRFCCETIMFEVIR